MRIWIDADACPKKVRDIVQRASERLRIPLCFVANAKIPFRPSALVNQIRVANEFDEADDYIATEVKAGDVVITADIPLAARVVANQAIAIDPRGELYSDATVHDRLATRNLLQQLRSDGQALSGPAPYSKSDIQRFAATLDRILTSLSKQGQ